MAMHVSWRSFNEVASAASVVVTAPFIHSKRARAQDSIDVLVIGSSLSGLNAAWNLSDAGMAAFGRRMYSFYRVVQVSCIHE